MSPTPAHPARERPSPPRESLLGPCTSENSPLPGGSPSQPWRAQRLGNLLFGLSPNVSAFYRCNASVVVWRFRVYRTELTQSNPSFRYSKGALTSFHLPPIPQIFLNIADSCKYSSESLEQPGPLSSECTSRHLSQLSRWGWKLCVSCASADGSSQSISLGFLFVWQTQYTVDILSLLSTERCC